MKKGRKRMDYRKTAKAVLEQIGGKENIVSAAHCATRLRLVIADNEKCSKADLEEIDGVKGVFESAGQLQIIFGTGVVNKVFADFIDLAGIEAGSKEDVKQAASSRQNWAKRAIKTLGDIFVPIIPAIVASGLLMGLLEGLCNVWPGMADSGTYTIIHLFSNAAFVFLPILIAMSAAKTFGGNIYLGAVIGMIMIHTDLTNAWSVSGMAASEIPKANVWFGLFHVNLVGYQGHVIPVVIAVWFMSVLEKKLHKIVPEIIDLFVTPLVTVLVTGYLTLTLIGPVFSTLENYVLDGARALVAIPFGIGGFLLGALYAPTVVAGVHHMYNAIEAGMLSSQGVNTWMPIATAANVAQGAAALAVAIKTKNAKTKSMAFPASLSAFLGITEPAIFGVNIRFFNSFIAGCIGGAFGGLVAGWTHIGASAYGITGLFGFLITTNYVVQYALVIVVSVVVAFTLSWILYKEPAACANAKKAENKPVPATPAVTAEKNTIYNPIKGTVIPLNEVPDETFAAGILGKGFGVKPETGVVVSPVNGEISTIFDTKHAIGITSEDGMEILIHVGINTVALDGKYYEALVKDGDKITVGQELLRFDIAEIEKEGYSMVTPVIVTNSDDYEEVNVIAKGAQNTSAAVAKVK